MKHSSRGVRLLVIYAKWFALVFVLNVAFDLIRQRPYVRWEWALFDAFWLPLGVLLVNALWDKGFPRKQ